MVQLSNVGSFGRRVDEGSNKDIARVLKGSVLLKFIVYQAFIRILVKHLYSMAQLGISQNDRHPTSLHDHLLRKSMVL